MEHPAFPADLLCQRGRCFLDPDEIDAKQSVGFLDETTQIEPRAAARRWRLHGQIDVGSRALVTSGSRPEEPHPDDFRVAREVGH